MLNQFIHWFYNRYSNRWTDGWMVCVWLLGWIAERDATLIGVQKWSGQLIQHKTCLLHVSRVTANNETRSKNKKQNCYFVVCFNRGIFRIVHCVRSCIAVFWSEAPCCVRKQKRKMKQEKQSVVWKRVFVSGLTATYQKSGQGYCGLDGRIT
jgi:hypothetical protein